MNALFRIEELAAGSCFIDGIDTSFIPLQKLRSKLGIIPQDPVMFSATVRFNLVSLIIGITTMNAATDLLHIGSLQ
jgi:ABC-type multidrug transport system fused ATPase/permease subunit